MRNTYYISLNQVSEFKWFIASLKGASIEYEHQIGDEVKFVIVTTLKSADNAIEGYIKNLNSKTSKFGAIIDEWRYPLMLIFLIAILLMWLAWLT